MSLIDTVEKKNQAILSRFESGKSAVKTKKYSIKFKNGKSCTCVDMNNSEPSQVVKSIYARFGQDRVESVTYDSTT